MGPNLKRSLTDALWEPCVAPRRFYGENAERALGMGNIDDSQAVVAGISYTNVNSECKRAARARTCTYIAFRSYVHRPACRLSPSVAARETNVHARGLQARTIRSWDRVCVFIPIDDAIQSFAIPIITEST